MDNSNSKNTVKEANRVLYDSIKDNYERIDGRRSEELHLWLKNRLKNIAKLTLGKDRLLDVGCGTGFVLSAGQGLFKRLYGVDISRNILRTAVQFADGVVCADSDFIPFLDNSMDAVVLFAALHHFFDYRDTLKEIYRVLKRNGVLYIDHDINKDFVYRFRFLLWLYRKMNAKKKKCMEKGIDGNLYELSEFHSDGVDSKGLLSCLGELGFVVVRETYHWYGLSRLTNSIFRQNIFKKRNAPLMNIVVRKI